MEADGVRSKTFDRMRMDEDEGSTNAMKCESSIVVSLGVARFLSHFPFTSVHSTP